MNPPTLETIQEYAERIIESEGLELIDLEFKAGKSRHLLRIFIDRTGGVTLDECEKVSRQLSAILDVHDLVKGAYILEVSSPGIDRPFRTDRDYDRNLGKTVKISFEDPEGKPRQEVGRLLEATDESVSLDVNGTLVQIGRERIRRAQQEILIPVHPGKNRKRWK